MKLEALSAKGCAHRPPAVTAPTDDQPSKEASLRGARLDFSETAPGATVQSAELQCAQLQRIVDVEYEVADVTGKLQARAYAAGSGAV